MINGVPVRSVPAHSGKEVLKPDLAALEKVYEGPARAGLSAADNATLEGVERDWKRTQELRQTLKVEGAVIGSGEAGPELLTSAAAHQQELTATDAALQEQVEAASARTGERLKAGQGYGPLTVFESGEQIYVNLQWEDQGVNYRMQRALGEPVFDVCATPVQAAAPENLTFLRMDVDPRSEEMQLCPGDQELRVSHLAPLGAGDSELVQHDRWRAGLEGLTAFQERFATQVLNHLGVAWPSLADCADCKA